ncbi:hypothetical protein CEXT_408331 [Caerostris extrusa]|uniref:Uncharacterized protein n=1 Tax=Caerostris extrusa TaxID=172846 RepID=A0AAV4SH17_CAEEX|nr:hypothetical protein CEXT_408331 [Caerostris extrusa]
MFFILVNVLTYFILFEAQWLTKGPQLIMPSQPEQILILITTHGLLSFSTMLTWVFSFYIPCSHVKASAGSLAEAILTMCSAFFF